MLGFSIKRIGITLGIGIISLIVLGSLIGSNPEVEQTSTSSPPSITPTTPEPQTSSTPTPAGDRSYLIKNYKLTTEGKNCILSKLNTLSKEGLLDIQEKIKKYPDFLSQESIEASLRQDLGCPRLVTPPPPQVQWQTVNSWSGTGPKKLGSAIIPTTKPITEWRFVFSWDNGVIDENYDRGFGIWICESDGQFSTCSFEIPAFNTPGATQMITAPRENFSGKTVGIEVRADPKTNWSVKIETKK